MIVRRGRSAAQLRQGARAGARSPSRSLPRFITLVLAVVLLLTAASCIGEVGSSSEPGVTPYSIEGAIALGDAPLGGVTVRFDGRGGPAAVTTDAGGRFRRDRFPPGVYAVRPDDGAYDFYYGGALVVPSFDLPTAAGGARLEAALRCDFSAAPAGARVDLLSPNGGGDAAYTDAPTTITFRVAGDPGARIEVSCRPSDDAAWSVVATCDLPAPPPPIAGADPWREHAVVWRPTQAMATARVRVGSVAYPVLRDQSDGTFVVAQSAAIAGTATHLGAALEGVLVQLYEGATPRYTTHTLPDGSYALNGIAPATYTILPAFTGFAFAPGTLGSTAVLAPGDALTGFDFTATPIGATVMVTWPNGGEVVFGGTVVTVTAAAPQLDGYRVDFDADTDGDGVYETAIASDVTVAGATATAAWTVPPLDGPNELTRARVRVRQGDLALADSSDAAFTISEQFGLSGSVTTDGTTPVGGAVVSFEGATAPPAVSTTATGAWAQTGFRRGRSYTVTVSRPATGIACAADAPDVALEQFGLVVRDLNGDGMLVGNELTHCDAAAGSSDAFPTSYTTGALAHDVSAIAFYAAPEGNTVEVVRPVGGATTVETDVWLNGQGARTIEWASTGAHRGATVEVGFSANAGATWNATPLFAATPNDGAEPWLVGACASVSYAASVRIVDSRYRLVRGASAIPFVLAPGGLMTVRTKRADGSPMDGVVVLVEPAGYVEFAPPVVDVLRPFLTSGNAALDSGVFPNGTYRLTPCRIGHTFEPPSAVVGSTSDTTFTCTGDGERWEMVTQSATSAPDTSAFTARVGHTAIWTGTAMVVWGGENGRYLATGGVWTPGPGGGSWMPTSLVGAPSARRSHTAVWTGTQMIVWGGYGSDDNLGDGAIWTPGALGGSWQPLSSDGAPSARYSHVAVWTGTQMVVLGGNDDVGGVVDGGIWSPGQQGGAWTSLSCGPAVDVGTGCFAAWTGEEILVWGVAACGSSTRGGFLLACTDDEWGWQSLATDGMPAYTSRQVCAWTGSEMIVWGGSTKFAEPSGMWTRSSGAWTSISPLGPEPRDASSAVWTGEEFVVWGGDPWTIPTNTDAPVGTGFVWSRQGTDGGVWTHLADTDAPSARWGHTAMWTGREMVVVGGVGVAYRLMQSAGRWSPAEGGGVWAPSQSREPPRRSACRTVWTGHQAVVWGGSLVTMVNSPDTMLDGIWTPSADGGGLEHDRRRQISFAQRASRGTMAR